MFAPVYICYMGAELFQNIFWFSAVISSIGTLIYSLQVRLKEDYLRLILVLLVISVSCSLTSIFCIFILERPKSIIGIIYRCLEFGILFNLFWIEFFKKNPKNNLIRLLVFLVLFLIILYFDVNAIRLVNGFLFVSASLVMYWAWIKNLPSADITEMPIFWVNSAIFIYFSSNLFLFLSRNYIRLNYYNEFPYLWSLSNFFAIIMNLCFIYAFHLSKTQVTRNARF